MKILQLVSDWKWTGPAEPMLVLMQALRDRGHQVDLICPKPPPGSNRSLWQEASDRDLDPIRAVPALRRAMASGDGPRAARLRRWLETEESAAAYDIVHCWHSRDHVLAARALRLGQPFAPRTRSTRLVRSFSRAEKITRWPWNRWLFGSACDGLICVSDATVEMNRGLCQGGAISSTTGAVDLEALQGRIDRPGVRSELGLSPSTKLIGVVARMQSHRRFDLLLNALKHLVRDEPEARLVVLGRGTHMDRVLRTPAREMGLEEHVVFAGYRIEDYAAVLGAMDVFTFLVPGSDGTCRALMQAAALGLPMVGSRRGAIPEIILNGQTGVLVAEDPLALAKAWRGLLSDPERCRRFGEAARRDASVRFCPDRFAAWMERFYADASR